MGAEALQSTSPFPCPSTVRLPFERANARPLTSHKVPAHAAAAAHKADPPAARGRDVWARSGRGLEQAFEGVAYHRRVEQAALAVQFRQAAAAVYSAAGSGDGESAVAVAQQMTFDFFAEVRTEESAFFEQRAAAVGEGLDGERQASYLQVSREVRARFQMSATISGVALSGFTHGAEALEGRGDLFDQFVGFAKDLLEQQDDLVNRIFELLDGFFMGAEGAETFETAFNALLEDIYSMLGQGMHAVAPGGASGQATAFTVQLEFEFTFSASITVEQGQVQESDPIVLDLDGDGIELTHHAAGARFDITGTGRQAATAFVTGGDAFLALDRNGNGKIDSGKELFGDQRGAANGYEELRKFDTNADGVINALDLDFDQLLLFRDNGNGVTEPGELISLADAGIESISLDYRNVNRRAAGANRLAQMGAYRRQDGTQGRAADAILSFTV